MTKYYLRPVVIDIYEMNKSRTIQYTYAENMINFTRHSFFNIVNLRSTLLLDSRHPTIINFGLFIPWCLIYVTALDK